MLHNCLYFLGVVQWLEGRRFVNWAFPVWSLYVLMQTWVPLYSGLFPQTENRHVGLNCNSKLSSGKTVNTVVVFLVITCVWDGLVMSSASHTMTTRKWQQLV